MVLETALSHSRSHFQHPTHIVEVELPGRRKGRLLISCCAIPTWYEDRSTLKDPTALAEGIEKVWDGGNPTGGHGRDTS